MAVYYAVEFPSEDSKSRGPHIVPKNKVKIENGKTQVLWGVVNEHGDFNGGIISRPQTSRKAPRRTVESLSITLKNQERRLT